MTREIGEHERERLEAVLVQVARQILDQGIDSLGPGWGCGPASADVSPERARGVLAAGACRLGVRCADPARLSSLAECIDHTLLRPDATAAEIDRLCDEALQHRFASVCVNGTWVRRAAEILAGSEVLVCCVAGFPLGAMAPEVKVYEAERALQDGACEIDMVLNVGALKSGDDRLVRRDIRGVAELCQRHGARLKVILETALLTDPEKVRACELARAAGADFVKTSSGFAKGGATVEDVALMRRSVGSAMGIKAAGGVRTAADARALLAAGATRIGASASVAIVREGA